VETPVNYEEGTYFVQAPPRIYGDRIVWMAESVGTNYNIYVYDLSTSTLTMIGYPYSTGYDSQPAIYGDRIVWTEGGEPGNTDIMMYDLSTSAGTQITTNGSSQSEPSIYGNRIVWQDARNGNQNDVSNYDIYMGILSEIPNADFSASTTSGNAPLTVKFTDRSTGSPTTWKWSFGDGSALVTKYNPMYTYTKPGTYTVKETVSNAAGKDTEIKTNYITVKAAPVKAPVAAFSASPISGKKPLKVQFTDKSSNTPTSWKWSFGDGTYSTSKSPSHIYSKAGKYTISLTVKNSKGNNTKTASGYITVR
jgi:beta propeller repeat protein